jgi:hypothetical protein
MEMQLFSQNLYKHLNACIYWIELTYDDTTKQEETKEKLSKFMNAVFGGPLHHFFGPLMGGVHWNKESLDLVDTFKGYMQNIIMTQTKEDTAMRREGIKLMNELDEMIVKLRDYIEPPPEKLKTDATLSNLLTRLTQIGNCST